MKMRYKILFLCLGCTMGALVLQTILFSNTSSSLIYEQSKNESYNNLQNMQNEIYTFIKSIENGLVVIYSEKQFLNDLRAETIVNLRSRYYRLAYNIALDNFTASEGIVALYLYNQENQIISTYRRAVTPKHNYPQDIYEKEEENNGRIVKNYIDSNNTTMLVSSYYNSYRETDITRFVLKIYDSNLRGNKIGYLVCDVDGKIFREIMNKYENQNEMYMWLQPLGDRPAVSVGNLEESNKSYCLDAIEKIQKGEWVSTESLTADQKVLFEVSQNKYNLGAYSVMPQFVLKENQKILTRNLLLIAAIMIVIITLLSFLVSKGLTKPLEKLTDTIDKIKKGNTALRAECEKRDEIGALGQDFNQMLDQIEGLISHEYETELLLNQAEYKALQAQINPHFLYNTLETMSSIASVQNCSIVSNLCESLSNIFRYSLDMKNPFSTVAQEIVHLRNYIFVMNVRMGDGISYTFHISEEVLQDEIPKISIQPLVENALNHGLRNKRGEKSIVIEAGVEDGELQIAVSDNGVGMNAQEVNERLRENNKELVEKGNSIGIYNINARMKMLYGEQYGLTVNSIIGEGTRVFLTVPRKKPEGYNDREETL